MRCKIKNGFFLQFRKMLLINDENVLDDFTETLIYWLNWWDASTIFSCQYMPVQYFMFILLLFYVHASTIFSKLFTYLLFLWTCVLCFKKYKSTTRIRWDEDNVRAVYTWNVVLYTVKSIILRKLSSSP